MRQEPFHRKLDGASGHALRYNGGSELDFSVGARQVQVKFVVTDVMYPVLSVANSRDDGVSLELRDTDGGVRRKVVNREPCDTGGDSRISARAPGDR